MQKFEVLVPGQYYHIYGKGIDGTSIFNSSEDYERFLHLFEKFIDPVCETFAWCLMGNHFHLLVRVKNLEFYPLKNQNRKMGKK